MNYEAYEVPASFFGVPDSLFANLTLEIDPKEMTATIIYVRVAEQHKGSFRRLVMAIEASPYKLIIFCPVLRTRKIISRMGYGPIDDDNWMKNVPASERQVRDGLHSYSYRSFIGELLE